jgi:hypothetical protein
MCKQYSRIYRILSHERLTLCWFLKFSQGRKAKDDLHLRPRKGEEQFLPVSLAMHTLVFVYPCVSSLVV